MNGERGSAVVPVLKALFSMKLAAFDLNISIARAVYAMDSTRPVDACSCFPAIPSQHVSG